MKTAAVELRRLAEERLKLKTTETGAICTEGETQRLVQELQIHQIELEMQNTELRQSRDEVENGLKKYTELYDFAPISYFTLDREGTISAANLRGATLIGMNRSQLLGKRFELFVTDEYRPFFSEFLRNLFSTHEKESCELTLREKGNQTLFVSIEAIASDSGGECRVAVIDISGYKRLEEKLKKMHADLSTRTAELEDANIELEAFNYRVSHDLCSPLTTINSYCQIILELYGNRLDEVCNGYIHEMYNGSLRMSRLIDTLLVFSRVTRVELSQELVDLSAMANVVAAELILAESTRRVIFRSSPGIMMNGDAGLWRIVLDNLIGNAIKYTRNREEALIEFGAAELNGIHICFIQDNGSGFAMEHAQKLFTPFYRIPETTAEGNGIGLSTVERIIRRQGGRIWAESKPGKGASFLFTLE